MLQALLGPVAGLAKTWMNNRHEQSQAKHQAKMQVISNTATWEEKMADASANVDRVRYSFDVLSTLPDWYQYLLFLAVSASFGIRGADKLMKLRAK